ncbi:MAG TPA: AAA family ATPase [Thermoanaerobaculaceae bacterium]|nr:AAA family ATPase [Thermoanaerobaculaceae bacterium]HRS17390.1 AAA family ATPase [Thermoanaerobaculaceae bacterium]
MNGQTASERTARAEDVFRRLEGRLRHAVKGRDDVIELVLIALLADGHVLLEDYPGSGKTTLAKTLGESIIDDIADDEIAAFRRIQFTPDLLPSDITGVSVFDAETSTFSFRRGPIFAYVVLGDEINRTSPKVQSAMLEAMAEKQVTVDNISYRLNDFFFVLATQNPQDLAGTYPLPVAQLDRFLFKIRMEYIDRESEIEVLRTRLDRRQPPGDGLPRVYRAEVIAARHIIEEEVYASPAILACLVDIAREIRSNPHVAQGISTRSLVMAVPALKARALARGRDWVSGEDVEALAPYIFAHRVSLAVPTADAAAIVKEALARPLEALARATLRG